MSQKTKLFWIRDHITTSELPPKFYLKAKSNKKDPNRIHEYVSKAEMAPKTNQIKFNWIHGHATIAKMAPKFNQMKLSWIHILSTMTELPPKPYQTITSENVKPNWIRWNHEHTTTAKMAPKSNQIIILEANKLDNTKPYWIHEHTIIVGMAPKSNQIIVLETIWIHDYSTSAESASRPKKQIKNQII